jgi:hypothetical protein
MLSYEDSSRAFMESRMSSDRIHDQQPNVESTEPANVVAWAGILFGIVAAILYGVLFLMLHELPSSRQELTDITANAPALTRLLVVGGSAGLLNIVSLILCLTGYVIQGQSRFEAIAGTAVSGLMLLAVFSVIIVSLLLTA